MISFTTREKQTNPSTVYELALSSQFVYMVLKTQGYNISVLSIFLSSSQVVEDFLHNCAVAERRARQKSYVVFLAVLAQSWI